MTDGAREFAGRYLIEGEIGRGGMGVVYRARHVPLDRTVALKVLPDSAARDSSFHDRFLRECATLARLQHPNVVAVYDGGEDAEGLYLAMEFVPGANLHAVLTRDGRIESAAAVEVAARIAAALDAAHALGIVHRDVKPGNVLIDGPVGAASIESGDTRVLLGDFGLARDVVAPPSATATFAYAGSPYYSAPEQLRGDDIGPAADQYSLACVLYECLTGSPPFRGVDPFSLARRDDGVEIPPVDPGAGRSRVDAAFARALDIDPDARFRSCAEFVAAVGEALSMSAGAEAPKGGTARSVPSTGTGLRRLLRAHPIAAASAAAVLIAGVVLPIALTRGGGSPHPASASGSHSSNGSVRNPGSGTGGGSAAAGQGVVAGGLCSSTQPASATSAAGNGAAGTGASTTTSAGPPSGSFGPALGGPAGSGTSGSTATSGATGGPGTTGTSIALSDSPYLGVKAETSFSSSSGPSQSGRVAGGAQIVGVLPRPDPLPPCLVPPDVIVDVDGTPVADVADLTTLVGSHHAGDVIILTWTHATGTGSSPTTLNAPITLASRPGGSTGDCTQSC